MWLPERGIETQSGGEEEEPGELRFDGRIVERRDAAGCQRSARAGVGQRAFGGRDVRAVDLLDGWDTRGHAVRA